VAIFVQSDLNFYKKTAQSGELASGRIAAILRFGRLQHHSQLQLAPRALQASKLSQNRFFVAGFPICC
jgi:hypothetical protein